MRFRRLAVLFALSLVACVDERSTVLRYEGSSTLALGTMPELSEAFASVHGQAFAEINASGSSRAVRAVLDGDAEIGGLSRSLIARERGEQPYAQIVGYDAIAVFVHASNPIWALGQAQVEALFTGRIRNWRELGGRDAPVELVLESDASGHATSSVFREVALRGEAFGPHLALDDKAQTLEYVATNRHAVTFAPLGLGRSELHPVAVDAIAPSHDNVASGAYPLSRSLVLVAAGLPEGKLAAFFEFVLSQQGQEIIARRHVPVVPVEDAPSVGASVQGLR